MLSAMPDAKRITHVPELGDVTKHNIEQLKLLNSVVFPISYNEKFYADVLELGQFAKLAWYNDLMVGAVCCRVEKDAAGEKNLYIMTLGCLEAYRHLGIGTTMLNHILKQCKKDSKISSIYLHVQVNNEAALKFYEKFGFQITSTTETYYKKIEPSSAHVLTKTLTVAQDQPQH